MYTWEKQQEAKKEAKERDKTRRGFIFAKQAINIPNYCRTFAPET